MTTVATAQTGTPTGLLAGVDLDAARDTRHDLHRHPELMFEERRTARVVREKLEAWGVACRSGLAARDADAAEPGTGVVGFLPARSADGSADPASAPTVALRAAIDALPIAEETGRLYASETPGVMHACGHDGHTAILLAAAQALAARHDRPNNVVFLFQPAEEGGAGGEKMCRDGALDGSLFDDLVDRGCPAAARVDRVFGLHGWPTMPVGAVGTRPGPLLAATDEFTLTIRGRGGHAAMPHYANDPIVAASAVVQSLQTIASRSTSPTDAVVCTIGKIAGGSVNNVIPEAVEMLGTVRTLRDDTRAAAEGRLREIVSHVAAAHGCRAELVWHTGYPSTVNDAALAEHVRAVATDAFGADRYQHVREPFMGGEDFSFYGRPQTRENGRVVPTCFFLIGLLPEGADPTRVPLLHQATFDFNDDALPVGVEMMVRLSTAAA